MSGVLLIVGIAAIGAALFLFLAWCVVDSGKLDLNAAIDRGIRTGIEKGLAEASKPGGQIDRVISNEMAKFLSAEMIKVAHQKVERKGALQPSGFVLEMAFEMIRCGEKDWPTAHDTAKERLRDYLREEKIAYGHRDYAWGQSAARDVIHEIEIEHWEAA